jgi:hypothetical protein
VRPPIRRHSLRDDPIRSLTPPPRPAIRRTQRPRHTVREPTTARSQQQK